jgi:hypothetical protein
MNTPSVSRFERGRGGCWGKRMDNPLRLAFRAREGAAMVLWVLMVQASWQVLLLVVVVVVVVVTSRDCKVPKIKFKKPIRNKEFKKSVTGAQTTSVVVWTLSVPLSFIDPSLSTGHVKPIPCLMFIVLQVSQVW